MWCLRFFLYLVATQVVQPLLMKQVLIIVMYRLVKEKIDDIINSLPYYVNPYIYGFFININY
jgi:hypothetical protein